ncbi:uncharacterized protein N7459_008632 [Penicillium hispanicum]|uniref:Uncharacterized protein n=1 Tax=Penicillium cinerascens TaxID=70096 RepID=A0A9W9JKW3_9EURO|nr:uncharacterized protein N7459_008632 [Penicillium hispanicum]XP_058307237.1 uncharacterized protein N7498_007926 [Penicillium cinerascens]KAJ5198809.1 hypothetical protein N7498_007926 [Penicillium cinerascens]KAJ5574205.1 hypothetical protein N7459_008632 [Penicillium hispanicum]
MDSEVPLPPPRRIRHRSPARAGTSPSSSIASSFRKARRLSRFDDRSSQPSSDPALFSSDDIPASGLENYNAPVTGGAGRKRRYRGTWWGEQVIDPKRKRADFKEKRQVDSGVWMGSDESTAESLLPSEDASAWGEDLLKTVLDPKATGKYPQGLALPKATAAPVLPLPIWKGLHESEQHKFARAVVNDCLEKGEDSIDLGNFDLREIPPGLLQPLQHLTKLPSVKEAPLSENAYSSLQPFLRVYLSGNSLTTLNNELFELGDLKVLSVRNNKLSEIPYTIQKLAALEVLNVSVNLLTHLPWELLRLLQHGELKHLTAFPNPFPSIEEGEITKWHRQPRKSQENGKPETSLEDQLRFDEYEGSPPKNAWATIHVATSPITRRDMEGNPIDDGSASVVTPVALPPSSSTPSAPSLRELALRAVCKLPGLEQVTDDELDDFPSLVAPLMYQARKIRAAGGQRCSVCQHEYVVPRTSWLEWWDCTPHESGMKRPRTSGEKLRPLPFQRHGCSWACVPRLQNI